MKKKCKKAYKIARCFSILTSVLKWVTPVGHGFFWGKFLSQKDKKDVLLVSWPPEL
jgi:hypothetical protein